MTVFLVVATSRGAELDQHIRSVGLSHMKLPRGEWLIASKGNSEALCKALQLKNGGIASGIVIEITHYDGYTDQGIIDWIEKNKKATHDHDASDGGFKSPYSGRGYGGGRSGY